MDGVGRRGFCCLFSVLCCMCLIFHNQLTDVLLSWNKCNFLFTTRNRGLFTIGLVCFSFWDRVSLYSTGCLQFAEILLPQHPTPECWDYGCEPPRRLTHGSGWLFLAFSYKCQAEPTVCGGFWSHAPVLSSCISRSRYFFRLLALLLWCFGQQWLITEYWGGTRVYNFRVLLHSSAVLSVLNLVRSGWGLDHFYSFSHPMIQGYHAFFWNLVKERNMVNWSLALGRRRRALWCGHLWWWKQHGGGGPWGCRKEQCRIWCLCEEEQWETTALLRTSSPWTQDNWSLYWWSFSSQSMWCL